MRKLVQMLLAAGALLPAPVVAQDGEPGARRSDRGGEWRQARDRSTRPDGGQPAAEVSIAAPPRDGGTGRGGWNRGDTPRPPVARDDRPRPDWNRADRPRWNGNDGVPRPPVVARPDRDRPDRPRWTGGDNDRGRGGWGDGRRDDRGGWNDRRGFGGWNDRDRWGDRGGWNRDWRQDRRYDWNGWRDRNRSAYRLPRYYAPYGWNGGYRRFGIGVRLSQPLFAQDYWIGDPWGYRLPPAEGPYRWVRYFNDAMLVDLRYGTVVDVVYDIFY